MTERHDNHNFFGSLLRKPQKPCGNRKCFYLYIFHMKIMKWIWKFVYYFLMVGGRFHCFTSPDNQISACRCTHTKCIQHMHMIGRCQPLLLLLLHHIRSVYGECVYVWCVSHISKCSVTFGIDDSVIRIAWGKLMTVTALANELWWAGHRWQSRRFINQRVRRQAREARKSSTTNEWPRPRP